jgi:hypothetical protein
MTGTAVSGSFRDPSGFLFTSGDVLYRQVNERYREHYDHAVSSGLFDALTSEGLLVPHEEADVSRAPAPGAYKVLRPELVEFVSYPYEWSFSMLKDAALLTLQVQQRALDHGMSMQDASAFNVQFHRGRPVLIDTLTFEKLREGKPWGAYSQFCQHFLAPLALIATADPRLGVLTKLHLDGVPLDLADTLLRGRGRRRPSLFLHIRSHARMQSRHGDTETKPTRRTFSERAMRGLIQSLENAVRKLDWEPKKGTWVDYYQKAAHYSDAAHDHKKDLVAKFLAEVAPSTVWDLGGNTGLFARIAAATGAFTVCLDVDPACVEANYRQLRSDNDPGPLPLVSDLTNPTPAIGWDNSERLSLAQRGPTDVGLALALIHHLAIGNNVPLPRVADFMAGICKALIIEFVPKSDPMVRKLLATRDDIFPDYTLDGFERAFATRFSIERREQILETDRHLYLLRRTGS